MEQSRRRNPNPRPIRGSGGQRNESRGNNVVYENRPNTHDYSERPYVHQGRQYSVQKQYRKGQQYSEQPYVPCNNDGVCDNPPRTRQPKSQKQQDNYYKQRRNYPPWPQDEEETDQTQVKHSQMKQIQVKQIQVKQMQVHQFQGQKEKNSRMTGKQIDIEDEYAKIKDESTTSQNDTSESQITSRENVPVDEGVHYIVQYHPGTASSGESTHSEQEDSQQFTQEESSLDEYEEDVEDVEDVIRRKLTTRDFDENFVESTTIIINDMKRTKQYLKYDYFKNIKRSYNDNLRELKEQKKEIVSRVVHVKEKKELFKTTQKKAEETLKNAKKDILNELAEIKKKRSECLDEYERSSSGDTFTADQYNTQLEGYSEQKKELIYQLNYGKKLKLASCEELEMKVREFNDKKYELREALKRISSMKEEIVSVYQEYLFYNREFLLSKNWREHSYKQCKRSFLEYVPFAILLDFYNLRFPNNRSDMEMNAYNRNKIFNALHDGCCKHCSYIGHIVDYCPYAKNQH